MSTEVEQLRQRIRELESQLHEKTSANNNAPRAKIETLSAEVVDTNPYR